MQVINRSPRYKNKYVHKRTSMSLQGLTAEEVSGRQKLGLIRFSVEQANQYDPVEEETESDEDSEDDLVQANIAKVSISDAKPERTSFSSFVPSWLSS